MIEPSSTVVRVRVIGKTKFYLCIDQMDDGTIDFSFSSDNWCSGGLMNRHNWTMAEIFEMFQSDDLNQWAADAWADHYEQSHWNSIGN